MTARTHSRGRALIATLVGLAVALLGSVAAPVTSPARAVAASDAGTPTPVSIVLTGLDPKAVTPGSTVTVRGTVSNTSSETLSNVRVTLRSSSQAVRTRYQLALDTDPSVQLGSTVSGVTDVVGEMEPGARANWTLEVPANRLGLGPFGVYPLAVEVRSTGSEGRVTTRLPTFLPWVPSSDEFKASRLVWVLPLTARIPQDLDGAFLDDSLASELGSDGRLGRLLDAGTAVDRTKASVVWAIDPALIQAVETMASTAKPYQVRARSSTQLSTKPGTGQAVAEHWLTRLRTAVSGGQVVALPYANPDVVALRRAGLEQEIATAAATGTPILEQALGVESLRGIAVPPGGYLDQATLNVLASGGANTVLLADDALPLRNPNAVPGVRADVTSASGSINAVLTDTTLSSVLGGAATAAGGTRLAEQRFIAETAMIAAQLPGRGSTIVVAPPDDWSPPSGFGAAVVTDSASVPWLTPISLAGVIAEQPGDQPRQALTYPDGQHDSELPQGDLKNVGNLRTQLAAFAAILTGVEPEPFVGQTNEAILRTESVAWRSEPSAAQRLRDGVGRELNAVMDNVRITPVGLVTLTSRRQKIPITISNALNQQVTVQLRLRAVNAARLTVEPPAPVTIEANRSRTVEVEVEATTTGRFRAETWLETPGSTPQRYGPAVTIELNSTAYGAVALSITGGALVLLFVAVGVRLTRRIRKGRTT